MKSTNKIKVSAGRRAFMAFNYLFFVCIIILCAYPLWYVLVQSLSGEIVSGEGVIWPYKFTLRNYQQVMQLKGLRRVQDFGAAHDNRLCRDGALLYAAGLSVL